MKHMFIPNAHFTCFTMFVGKMALKSKESSTMEGIAPKAGVVLIDFM